MKKNILLLFAILLIQNCFGQNYDPKKVSSTATSILFSKSEMCGFAYEGTIYYVEDDLQTVIAIKDSKVLWEKNVILKCKKNATAGTKIKMLKVLKGILQVNYSNGFLMIELDGNIICDAKRASGKAR